MRPLRIEFQAFGPYLGKEMVDFEALSSQGLFLICGKTGVGKTMLLDAMTYALYGKSSGNGRGSFEAMRCTNAQFTDTTFVRFEFENHGGVYRFERRLEPKRKKLSAVYNVMQRENLENGLFRWRPLFENPKEKDLERTAVEIIGLEYEQFRQVMVLPQGQFEKLLTSNSEEKEKILTSIFGEEKWQRIAGKFFEEAAERKECLQKKKEEIESRLREEGCASMEELGLRIVEKKQGLEKLECEYEEADYGKRMQEEQKRLVLAKRFSDLHKAEAEASKLERGYKKREDCEQKLKNALRAEKVRVLLEEVEHCQGEKKIREDEEAGARKQAEAAGKKAEKALLDLKAHLETEEKNEEKKKLRILYEGKRSDYEGMDQIQKELNAKKRAEKKAAAEEAAAKEAYEEYAPQIVKLQKEYETRMHKHGELLEGYLLGITGELAGQLKEGEPCPVCGSISHPHKAELAGQGITKQQVDKKKKEADKTYEELQNVLEEQKQAKERYDSRHEAVQAAHEVLAGIEAKLEGMAKNRVEGIDSLKKLDAAIEKLAGEIEEFSNKKARLEAVEKTAREHATKQNARIVPARKEADAAREKLLKAEKALEQGLMEHQFTSGEEAKKLLLSENAIEGLKNEISEYDAQQKAAAKTLMELQKELSGKEEAKEEECSRRMKEITAAMSEYSKKQGVFQSELVHLQEKEVKLKAEGEGLEEKLRQAEEDVAFAKKLRGDTGTSLQRYVLGIMFSSVVAAANQMLERVHGGRYRLFRSDEKTGGSKKKGLELKVFDKNSEESEGRFVNTLSGGEKFLVSLALSIGLSTVAQKSGMKMEALFIDEGFGSLDEDSIGDAMEVLNSIQAANGMVGIISHVQLLQERIPVKLQVERYGKGSRMVQKLG